VRDDSAPWQATLSAADAARLRCSVRKGVIGGIGFAADASGAAIPGLVDVAVRARMLGPAPGQVELWGGTGPTTAGRHGIVRYVHDATLLFGSLEVDERAYTSAGESSDGKSALHRATASAYADAVGALEATAFRHFVRIWNFVPAINVDADGLERYRQFNTGRQEGFRAKGRATVGRVPAASAVGTADGPLVIYFLASRVEPLPIENPRQVSAYLYPGEYGPASPTFSRAAILPLDGRALLFVSGTASIVGHRSVHPADIALQVDETLVNIEAVVAEANRATPSAGFSLRGLRYRCYLRRPEDLECVRSALAVRLGAEPHAVFVHADICRRELLVEIEAIGGL
jgi:enamine deaminase RidA (YjgF/YER057c/UK114 family)